MRWEIVTSLATLVAVLVTIIIFLCSSARESRMRLIDNFNKMYQKTFSLRTELSTFSDKEYGESFYYELDNIQLNAEIQEHLLDYLTEMEDFFFLVVGHKSARHTFERLMSLPLYQRLTAVYGFIIKRRLETMYHACFLNYEKALDEISKMRKIKKAKAAVRYYYVGIRSSDRMYDSNFFQEDIAQTKMLL